MHTIYEPHPHMPKVGEESFTTLFQNDKLQIERIDSCSFSDGAWQEQEEDEWVVLLKGEATLEFETHEVVLACGAYIYIPKKQRHRVKETSKEALWLAVRF